MKQEKYTFMKRKVHVHLKKTIYVVNGGIMQFFAVMFLRATNIVIIECRKHFEMQCWLLNKSVSTLI